MSIASKGFLSCQIKRYTRSFRARYREEFALARSLSEVAQRAIGAVRVPSSTPDADSKAMAAMLLSRAASTFQGVILLSEKGMVVEARTLARSCYENAACLGAVANQKDAILPRLVAASGHEKRKLFSDLLHPDMEQYLDTEVRADLARRHAELVQENPPKYSVFDMAREAGIGGLYHTYRHLSTDAAHPGIDALERYFDPAVADGRRILRWGPESAGEDLPVTILSACGFFLAALSAANDMVGNDEIGEEIGRQFDVYKELLAENDVEMPTAGEL